MNAFTFKELVVSLIGYKKSIMIHLSIAFCIGLIIAFSIPKRYTASCTLIAEVQQNGLGMGMSSIASMAGINMNSSEDAIIPDFYPTVVGSYPFIVSLLYDTVQTKDEQRLLVINYLKTEKNPWWSTIIGLPAKLLQSLDDDNSKGKNGRINPEYMSKKEEQVVKRLSGSIGCSVSAVDGSISISATLQDPLAAKKIVDEMTKKLQTFIVEYRTTKARNDVDYYTKMTNDMRQRYMQAQQKYSAYCDTHNDVLLQSYISERDNLENEMQMAHNAYQLMEQQLLKSEAKYRERIPAFTVVEPASVPNDATSPKRMFIVFALMFVMFCVDFAMVYYKLLFK